MRTRKAKPAQALDAGIEHHGVTPYMKSYMDWCETMNYTPHTVSSRGHALRWFIQWCDARGLDRPQDITKPILERYQRHLYHYRKTNGKPLSFSTQAARLQAVKAFFKWLARQNHILYNPASELTLPKQPRQLPRHLLSVQDIDAVLRQTQYTSETGLRDRAIIETFYSTGLRRMELLNLKLYDLDFEQGTVFVRAGKGQRDRVVPIGDRALAWIRKYLDELRPTLVMPPDEGHLFISDQGQGFHKEQLGALVKKYLLRSGIDAIGSCHLFRHAMATHMLDGGADIRYIQAILGHADLKSTQIYTQVQIHKLKEIHNATHPARLKTEDSEQRTEEDINNETEAALLTLLAEDVETEQ